MSDCPHCFHGTIFGPLDEPPRACPHCLLYELRNPQIGWSGDASAVSALTASAAADEIERLRLELARYSKWNRYYDVSDHLGWDLRLIADNADERAGFETMNAIIIRRAAGCFDGLPESVSHEAALRMTRETSSAKNTEAP